MNKEYLTDNISDELLAGLTDKMLRFEKIQQAKKSKLNLLKIIPAVALVIGLVNLIPIFSVLIENEFIAGISSKHDKLSEYAGTAEVTTYDEFMQAIEDNIKTIYVNGNISIKNIDGDGVYLESEQEIYILPGSELIVYTQNFFVFGNIINQGTIKVYGRMLLCNEPIEYGIINNINSGKTEYYCGDITVGKMKRILNGDLPYTGIAVAAGIVHVCKDGCESSDDIESVTVIIDEDYTLPEGKELWLNTITTLKVAEGATFTVNGLVETCNAPIIEGELIGNINGEDAQTYDSDNNFIGDVRHYRITRDGE